MNDDERALWQQAHAGDDDALRILADLWEEAGRTESPGLRWLADHDVRPIALQNGSYWYWPDGRLPNAAQDAMRAAIGELWWIRSSFVDVMTTAAAGLAASEAK